MSTEIVHSFSSLTIGSHIDVDIVQVIFNQRYTKIDFIGKISQFDSSFPVKKCFFFRILLLLKDPSASCEKVFSSLWNSKLTETWKVAKV